MSWSVITSDITASAGDSYFCDGTTSINVTLPASASLGDTFTVYAIDTGGWAIVQTAGQQLRYQGNLSTMGTTGGLLGDRMGLHVSNTVTLTYCNGIWEVTSYQGPLSLV